MYFRHQRSNWKSKLNVGNRNSATTASLEASQYCVGAAILSAARSSHPLQKISDSARSQHRRPLHEEQGWKYTPLHKHTHTPACPQKPWKSRALSSWPELLPFSQSTEIRGINKKRRPWWHRSPALLSVSPCSVPSQILQRKCQLRPSHRVFYSKRKWPYKRCPCTSLLPPAGFTSSAEQSSAADQSPQTPAWEGGQYISCCSSPAIVIQQMPQCLSSTGHLTSCVLMVPRTILTVLQWADQRTAPQLPQGTSPRTGLGFHTGP